MSYRYIITISGKTVEINAYNRSQNKIHRLETPSERNPDNKKLIQNIVRSKNMLRRLIDCNFNSNHQFITFTYHRNETDIATVHRDRKMLLRKLGTQAKRRRKNRVPFRYIGVYEKQRRGAYHLHIIVNRNFSATELESVWKKGFIKKNKIRKIKHVGAYIAKYLTKESQNTLGSHAYFRSRGLIQPRIYRTFYPPPILTKVPAYRKDKYNKYRGDFTYMLYSLH